jgi:hypothetical protein
MIDRQMLARLPLRFWIQLAIGLAVLGVFAAFGLAVLLAGTLIVLGLGLVLQIVAWFHPRAPRRETSRIIEGEYRVERPDLEQRDRLR